MTTKIFLIRHGESHQNITDVLSGVTDVPLSEKGKEQCAALAHYFEDRKINKVFASPLQRAKDSTKLIFPKHETLIEFVQSLIEFNYVDYEGYKRSEYDSSNDRIIQQWITAPSNLTFSGGDNIQEHAQRTLTGITKLADENKGTILA